MLNHLTDNAFQAINDLLFLLSECHLIGKLKEITGCLRALAVETPGRQVQFGYRLDDAVYLLCYHQGRQVQHHRGPHPGACIRRTGSQVAEVR